jgi:hypothetical protein
VSLDSCSVNIRGAHNASLGKYLDTIKIKWFNKMTRNVTHKYKLRRLYRDNRVLIGK